MMMMGIYSKGKCLTTENAANFLHIKITIIVISLHITKIQVASQSATFFLPSVTSLKVYILYKTNIDEISLKGVPSHF